MAIFNKCSIKSLAVVAPAVAALRMEKLSEKKLKKDRETQQRINDLVQNLENRKFVLDDNSKYPQFAPKKTINNTMPDFAAIEEELIKENYANYGMKLIKEKKKAVKTMKAYAKEHQDELEQGFPKKKAQIKNMNRSARERERLRRNTDWKNVESNCENNVKEILEKVQKLQVEIAQLQVANEPTKQERSKLGPSMHLKWLEQQSRDRTGEHAAFEQERQQYKKWAIGGLLLFALVLFILRFSLPLLSQ